MQTLNLQTDTLIKAAGHWFLKSGIVDAGGGVARFYRSDIRRNAPISYEITGYAVSALLFFHERTGESVYLDAALRSARFLARSAWSGTLCIFPFEQLNSEDSTGLAYFFDSGIIARGLLAAWRVTENDEFLDAAIASGRSMLSDFPMPGAIHPILALPRKHPLPWEPRWSASPGCYQLKSAMAWLELFEATGEGAFLRGYESALEGALANAVEFLPGDPDRLRVMDRLHPYAYFLEGLLPVLQRPECAAAFREGIERAGRYLREIAPVFVRSDVYAQLLRVRLFGEAAAVLPIDTSAAGHEAEQAASFQQTSEEARADPAIWGGFLFGRKQGPRQSEDLPFVNPVSTVFCAQALALWDDRRAGVLSLKPQALI